MMMMWHLTDVLLSTLWNKFNLSYSTGFFCFVGRGQGHTINVEKLYRYERKIDSAKEQKNFHNFFPVKYAGFFTALRSSLRASVQTMS